MTESPVPDEFEALFALFEHTRRQAPGSVETTCRALALLPPELAPRRVVDFGCGTGGSTLVLAAQTGGLVTAVDLSPRFLAALRARAEEKGLSDRIDTIAGDMSETRGIDAPVDLIWAEGSAYAIGFEHALSTWRKLLRPGGCLVATELAWFVPEPDPEVAAFFAAEYPAMTDEAGCLAAARRAGHEILASFRLPGADWHAYFDGFRAPLDAAIARHGRVGVYAMLEREREVYGTWGSQYGYLCLVLRNGGGEPVEPGGAREPGVPGAGR